MLDVLPIARKALIGVWVGAVVSTVSFTAHADAPLATLGNLKITAEDLNADLLRLPPEARRGAMSDPAAVQQAVSNLLIRRAMAAEAEKLGLQNKPEFDRQMRMVRDRILSDAWLAKVDAEHTLSDAELDRITQLKYQAEAFSRFKQPGQIKVRHILLPKTDEGRAKAEELLKKVKEGGDFAELAKLHSTDPGSGSRGGDLGFVARGAMVPAFDQAAFNLAKPGDLSDVVESGFGYHIIRLDEKQQDQIAPYAEVKEGLKNEVQNKAKNDARNAAAAELFKAVKLSEEGMAAFIEQAKGVKK